MGKYDKIAKRLERIIKQFTESPNKADGLLIPEAAIKGTGHIWCYCAAKEHTFESHEEQKSLSLRAKKTDMEKYLYIPFAGV